VQTGTTPKYIGLDVDIPETQALRRRKAMGVTPCVPGPRTVAAPGIARRSAAGRRRHAAIVAGPIRLGRDVGGRRVSVAVSELCAHRRAHSLSDMVTFSGSSDLHCRCSDQRRAENGENCLSHGNLPFRIIAKRQRFASCVRRRWRWLGDLRIRGNGKDYQPQVDNPGLIVNLPLLPARTPPAIARPSCSRPLTLASDICAASVSMAFAARVGV
jgi:hypothetical protein